MTSDSIRVSFKNYIFDPRPRFPFQIAAKRYWIGELLPDVDDHDALSKAEGDIRTLVFLHGIGFHKEHFEPMMQQLFEHQKAASQKTLQFRDMWSLDMPNHGDSAVLNEEVLRWGYDTFSLETCARGVHAFLAGLGAGVDVDFSKRRLTLIGHSMGGSTLTLMPTYYPSLKISSLHLIEPNLIGESGLNWISRYTKPPTTRDDIWPSAEVAYKELRVRRLYHDWDDRVLKILVKHGLRSLPTAEYPDKTEGVTPKCTKKQHAASCRDFAFYSAVYRYLPHVLKEIPTHIMYGSTVDVLPYELRQEALHVASGGISNFASTATIPGVGHTMVQTHPEIVGDAIWKQLNESHINDSVFAKL